MQGTKVSWEHHPVFINNVTLSISNSAQTNMQFYPLPSSQYTASTVAQNHGITPYHSFTGQHLTPLGNIHAPLKGPTSAAGGFGASDVVKNIKSDAAVAGSGTEQPQPACSFGGVYKDRTKWCAVLEVPNRFESASENYRVTQPCEMKQIFLGRFDHVEEARYVYKKVWLVGFILL